MRPFRIFDFGFWIGRSERNKAIGFALCALLLALGFSAEAQQPPHAADKIRIGFPDMTGPFVPLPIGQKMGFFQEAGLQPEIIRINALQALVSGGLDYYTVIGPGVAAAIRKVPVKVVGCYTFASTVALIARPEFKSI